MEGDERSRPPLIDPSTTSFIKLNSLRYETRFYEWQALCHVASELSVRVLTHVRQLQANATRLQMPEVDGIMELTGRRICIEVKSYTLRKEEIERIISKYSTFKFDGLIVVAPCFEFGGILPAGVRLMSFGPDLNAIRDAYYNAPPYRLPFDLEREFQFGDHHFRYVSACRKKGQVATFRNQVDKKIGLLPENWSS